MPIPLLARRRVLALGAETTPGGAVTLSNADAAFKTQEHRIKIVRETGMQNAVNSGGESVGVAEAAHTELTLSAFLVGSGSSNMANLMGLLMPAAGFLLTGGSFARTWQGSNWATLSGADYRDGKRILARGLMGNVVFNFTPGMRATIEASMQGGYVTNRTDAALLTGMSYQSAQPPVWSPPSGTSGTMLTLDSQTIFKPGKLGIDLGNKFSLREDPNSIGGYCCAWLETGAARWTLDPEAVLAATEDWYTKQSSSGTFVASVVLNGGSNNTWTFTMNAQIVSAPEADERNGKETENLVLGEVGDSLTVALT